MENEKVKYLIGMINNMDIKDKLRLAICMSKSEWSGLIYNTKENYEKFHIFWKIGGSKLFLLVKGGNFMQLIRAPTLLCFNQLKQRLNSKSKEKYTCQKN